MPIETRGIRNNNPGNIRYDSHSFWDGLSNPPSDGVFCVFMDAKYGIRVMFKLLLAYQQRHNLRTVRAMIDRWAPPVENDTHAYVEYVARGMGFDPDKQFTFNGQLAVLMVEAMIRMENGKNPYRQDVILAGARLAGLDVDVALPGVPMGEDT